MTEYTEADKEELFEERAAIYEYDAHKWRRYAESLAKAWMFDVWAKPKCSSLCAKNEPCMVNESGICEDIKIFTHL